MRATCHAQFILLDLIILLCLAMSKSYEADYVILVELGFNYFMYSVV
jgi:hypothetical protein